MGIQTLGLLQATEQELLNQLAAENYVWGRFELKNYAVGQELLSRTPEAQARFVMTAVRNLSFKQTVGGSSAWWITSEVIQTLLRRKLPFRRDELLELLHFSGGSWSSLTPHAIRALEFSELDCGRDGELKAHVERLISSLSNSYSSSETRGWVRRLTALLGQAEIAFNLQPGEVWSDAVLAELQDQLAGSRQAWVALLHFCGQNSGSNPSGKWLKAGAQHVEAVGFENFKAALLRWFPLVDKPRLQPPREHQWWGATDTHLYITEVNADILKGLAWLCAHREDKDLAHALKALGISTYRKIPGIGPRCVRLGNACVTALGTMPGTEGVAQLALLKLKVKGNATQKSIEKALLTAAKRLNLPADEIEELSVPTYGLPEVGARRETLGEFTAELLIAGTHEVELQWRKADGKSQASVPKAVKEQHATELKELQQSVKEIATMLPAQRDRIENLYLAQKQWSFAVWRERYLDHPLIGTLARRLIWRFTRADQTSAGIYFEGRLANLAGDALDWLDAETRVEMWHPLDEPTAQVLAWREWLAEREIRQPFKQAYREIYVLTEAERATHVYSNRFAAHIIKQHQFNALCGARGWRNQLRLMVDNDVAPPHRFLPAWNLRAEFWVDSIGDNFGTDTNHTGTFLYLTTDQVRFYPLDARMNAGHACGGGYGESYWSRLRGETLEPIPLDQIPPLVLSEIMRDVDLFVGVASVANDPTWNDSGRDGQQRDYWQSFSFGELTATANTRKQVLERLIPRLKIAERCRLNERFLIVRGDLRTYKIHLGSGNILMEPNDQYLCIVPARGTADGGGKVFLPFEGDNVLSIILSKAFLLVEDKLIKDPTIRLQLGTR